MTKAADKATKKVKYNAADHAAAVAAWKAIPGEQAKFYAMDKFKKDDARAVVDSGYWPWTGKTQSGETVTLDQSQWLQAASIGSLG